MIPYCKVAEVQRFLDEGVLSHRQIALRTGISRASISAIADGTRPDYESRRRERQLRDAEAETAGPVERCGGCGGLTQIPCRLCRVRQIDAQRREARRRRRQQLRERELRRLLLIQRAIAMGQLNQFRRPAA
jgi:hypothetical protein